MDIKITTTISLQECLDRLKTLYSEYHLHLERCGGNDTFEHERLALIARDRVLELQKAILDAHKLIRTPATTDFFQKFYENKISYKDFTELLNQHVQEQETEGFFREAYQTLIERIAEADLLPRNEGVVFLKRGADF